MRIRPLDLARGFTVLMIAPIHTMMLYSEHNVHETLLGKIFQFIAEGPGAQLFMTVMGIIFKANKFTLRRACTLLIVAYALNIIKFIIPGLFNILPQSFKTLLPATLIDTLLIGDILHFAAIAMMILFLIRYFTSDPHIPLVLAIVVIFVSPFLWDIHDNNIFIDHFLDLAGGAPPQTYFPLFPWLVYPLTGLAISNYINQGPELFSRFKYFGAALIMVGLLFDDGKTITFYRTYPPSTFIHLGIVLITLSAWQVYHEYVKRNIFSRLLEFMSRNITKVYIIQWIIIIWMLPVFGFQQLNFLSTVLATLFTTAFTIFITVAINFYHDWK